MEDRAMGDQVMGDQGMGDQEMEDQVEEPVSGLCHIPSGSFGCIGLTISEKA